LTKVHVVAPRSRYSIYVNDERFPGPSGERLLANTAVSTILRSTAGIPIIVERTMWWPHPNWHETHNAAAAVQTGTVWAVAGGHAGAPDAGQTYVLVANTSPFQGQARVTVLYEDGGTSSRVLMLPPSSRTSVPIANVFPGANDRRFGVRVDSLGPMPAQLIVESAVYGDHNGVVWASGTAVLGKRIE
jgi:hypothetical protein